jgi:hypothetical protein
MQYVIRLSVFLCVLSGFSQAYAQSNKVQIRQTQINDPANGVDDQFGYSVAVSGNLVAVGAPQFAGGASYAYLFMNEGSGWKQVARLDDGGGGDQFGWAVAASKDIVAVGNPHYGAGGAVFVFEKPGDGWRNIPPMAELTVPGLGLGLGGSLAISTDGKTIVAGVPGLNGDTGGTCVFVEPEGGWTNMTEATATLTALTDSGAGASVALGGNMIIVGEDTGQLGAAYVFVEPTSGWSSTNQPNAMLTAFDESVIDNFGYSVAISGNTVVVGSRYHDVAGAAYVYVEPPTGWQDMTQTAELGLSTNSGIELGNAVGIENNIVLAGAPLNDIGHTHDQGAVFGYVEPAKGWQSTTSPNGSVTAQHGVANERFGSTLAMSGKKFVVGVPQYNGLIGAVYIFEAQ